MPIVIPKRLPAYKTLNEENVFVMPKSRAKNQDIRPLEVAIVNLMPTKETTETQLIRMLSNSPLQVNLHLLHMGSHESKNTDKDHLENFYETLDEIKNKKFDGMIITGAPVEFLPFEEVDYWRELTELMEYSKENVYSTMYICWGAQAGLYYHYGVEKYALDEKIFGVFPHKINNPKSVLVRGFDEEFYVPHSRHTQVRREDILKVPGLEIIAESEEAGPHIIATKNRRQIFVQGHAEYDRETLNKEYQRDLIKGLDAKMPANYFHKDDPRQGITVKWKSHANLFYTNWLNYYVYQNTPYDITHINSCLDI